MNISIIGCGAWGMGIAMQLTRNGHDVTVWCHSDEVAADLTKTRQLAGAFPDVFFPESIVFTTDKALTANDKDLIVFAVASPYTRSTAEAFKPYISAGQRIISVTKGVEEKTLETQAEILGDIYPDAMIGVLSGPTHAEEVVLNMPTSIVSASDSREMAEFVQDVFNSLTFRVYTSPDVLGVELGGSLKNVIALAAGMADGMGYGDNLKAALITRGIYELSNLAEKMGAKPETLFGLSGIGDLIVTCASVHSRNRHCGVLMGQGKTMDEAVKEVGQVVEGIYSAKAALALAEKYDVQMPIIEAVNRVLFEDMKVGDAVCELMGRTKKMEHSVKAEDLPERWRL